MSPAKPYVAPTKLNVNWPDKKLYERLQVQAKIERRSSTELIRHAVKLYLESDEVREFNRRER